MVYSNKTHIFCFHRISDEYSPAYPPIPVAIFERICRYISKKYMVVPLQEMEEHINSRKPRAVITFDDGFYDFYENALPILWKYKLPATQHIITSCVETGKSFWTQKLNKIVEKYFENDKSIIIPELNINYDTKNKNQIESVALSIYKQLLMIPNREYYLNKLIAKINTSIKTTRMMTWNNLIDCGNYGITFGSHTHSHKNLCKLTKEDLYFELNKSALLINKHINPHYKLSLAFPNGMYNKIVIELAKKSGYTYLLTTEEKMLDINDLPLVPRISMYHNVWWKNYLKLTLWYYRK